MRLWRKFLTTSIALSINPHLFIHPVFQLLIPPLLMIEEPSVIRHQIFLSRLLHLLLVLVGLCLLPHVLRELPRLGRLTLRTLLLLLELHLQDTLQGGTRLRVLQLHLGRGVVPKNLRTLRGPSIGWTEYTLIGSLHI